jgi:hypothetical protein
LLLPLALALPHVRAAWRRFFKLETFEGNEATDWGEAHEAEALREYKERYQPVNELSMSGFITHPDLPWLGCSPDVLVGTNCLGEVKCPFSQSLYPEIPPYYMAQMQGQMEITNRDFCDFIVWTPEQMSVQTVARSSEYWQWMYEKLAEFWIYIEAGIEPPRQKRPTPPKTDHLLGTQLIFQLAI